MAAGTKIIVHVDMDAFFAAVEQLDNPSLRGKPVVVGADPKQGKGRGVVSAASYEARKFGIHSALPISIAYKRCPQAVFVKPRMKRYLEISHIVMDIFTEFSPVIEPLSIDEAFLDCTGTERLFGPSNLLGKAIKERILERTGLTASVGIASNKSIAKIASDLQKPDGLTICPHGEEKIFLSPLPISKLWGAGKKTVEYLHSLGIKTIGQLAALPIETLEKKLGTHGIHLWLLANGIDTREVAPDWEIKSISEEITFEIDTEDIALLEKTILDLSDQVARRTRNEHKCGKTITLKIRLEGFETHTRSKTLQNPVNDMFSIRDVALTLFQNFYRKNKKVRLIGVRISNLCKEGEAILQTGYLPFESDSVKEIQKKKKIESVLDTLQNEFGRQVMRASLMNVRYKREKDV